MDTRIEILEAMMLIVNMRIEMIYLKERIKKLERKLDEKVTEFK